MTEQEFWEELEKHRGEFTLTPSVGGLRFIRHTKNRLVSPLNHIAGFDNIIPPQNILKYFGNEQWVSDMMDAADDVDRGEIRKRMLDVLGIEEAT